MIYHYYPPIYIYIFATVPKKWKCNGGFEHKTIDTSWELEAPQSQERIEPSRWSCAKLRKPIEYHWMGWTIGPFQKKYHHTCSTTVVSQPLKHVETHGQLSAKVTESRIQGSTAASTNALFLDLPNAKASSFLRLSESVRLQVGCKIHGFLSALDCFLSIQWFWFFLRRRIRRLDSKLQDLEVFQVQHCSLPYGNSIASPSLTGSQISITTQDKKLANSESIQAKAQLRRRIMVINI